MTGGEATDGFFEMLVSKQAHKEVSQHLKQELTESQKATLHSFFATLKGKAGTLKNDDLKPFLKEGLPLDSTMVMFAGFLYGVVTPRLQDPEIRTEMHGAAGVRLWLGSRIFGYHDIVKNIVYLPLPHMLMGMGGRFLGFYLGVFKALTEWKGGVTMTSESSVTFEDTWSGEQSKTVLQEVVKLMCHNLTFEHNVGSTFKEIEEVAELEKMMED